MEEPYGIKSRGRGGIDTRNVFGHKFIQLTRVCKMERLLNFVCGTDALNWRGTAGFLLQGL
eukprot:974587-Pelagomonas_calceolata.AAC.1